jgi:hypothetical protein
VGTKRNDPGHRAGVGDDVFQISSRVNSDDFPCDYWAGELAIVEVGIEPMFRE